MSQPKEPKQTWLDLHLSRASNFTTVVTAIAAAAVAIWTYATGSWIPVALALGVLMIFVAPLVPISLRQYRNFYLGLVGQPQVPIDATAVEKLFTLTDRTMQLSNKRFEDLEGRLLEIAEAHRSLSAAVSAVESAFYPPDQNDIGQRALPERLRRLEAVQNDHRWSVPAIQQLWERTMALGFVGYMERIAVLRQTGSEIERILFSERPSEDLNQKVEAWLRASEMASRVVRPYDNFMAGKLVTSPGSDEIAEQLPRYGNLEFPTSISGTADASSPWHAISSLLAYKLRLFWVRWAALGQFSADLGSPFFREIDRSVS